MVHYVYRTTIPDGRFYIGCHQTKRNYFDDKYLGSGKLLKSYLRENGREGVKKSVIGIFMGREEAHQYELSQQKKYLEISPELCLFTVRSHRDTTSQEHRDNISKAQLGNQYALGYRHTKETKEKMSESHRRENLLPETRQRMREAARGENNSFYGKTHTPETKEKIRQAALARSARKRAGLDVK